MKGLISLAVFVAFFVAIPQCLGQSQDAEKDASQLLTEQQLVQMLHMLVVQAGQSEDVRICHIPSGRGGLGGFIMFTTFKGFEGHKKHGDCECTEDDLPSRSTPCECVDQDTCQEFSP